QHGDRFGFGEVVDVERLAGRRHPAFITGARDVGVELVSPAEGVTEVRRVTGRTPPAGSGRPEPLQRELKQVALLGARAHALVTLPRLAVMLPRGSLTENRTGEHSGVL